MSDQNYGETENSAVNLTTEGKLRLQSYVMTTGTRTLMIFGIAVTAISLLGAASSDAPFLFVGFGSFGISMLILTTVTRPLDRILAQLIEINDKLDDEIATREE